MTPTVSSRTRDRRSRQTFWIDDRVIDDFGPVMRRYPFGAAALAVYAVLARRADRDGDSWPGLSLIAAESGTSVRTVHKALRLLELLGTRGDLGLLRAGLSAPDEQSLHAADATG